MPICELLTIVPQEEMMNPVFLKEEGAEEEDEEATNEIKEITDNCVELMTKVNRVLVDIIADNRRMKEDLKEGRRRQQQTSLANAFKKLLESQV